MAKHQRQVGGSKEAPLVVAGSEEVGEQHKKTLTPSDAEYLRYRELLQGFFQKITRWLKIAQAEENEKSRGFSVFNSDNILSIKPSTTEVWERAETPNKVLQLRDHKYLNEPEYEIFGEEIIIRSAPAGKHLLIDMDNTPIEEVQIKVQSQFASTPEDDFSMQELRIMTKVESEIPGANDGREVNYFLKGDTLRVSPQLSVYPLMPDEYAVHLFNTIDSLIPGSTSPILQPERIASTEIPTPRALPPARRRTSRG